MLRHKLINQLHKFREVLAKMNLRTAELSPEVVDKIRQLRKALKALPSMDEATQAQPGTCASRAQASDPSSCGVRSIRCFS